MNATATTTAPRKPGTYIKKRREAAGLSLTELSLRLAGPNKGAALLIEKAIEAIEADSPSLKELIDRPMLDELGEAFSFDRDVYFALVAADADPSRPVPEICRICACSWNNPCSDPMLGPCSWAETAEGEQPICSVCRLKSPDALADPAGDLDDPEAGLVFAVADVEGDECPDCGHELGPVFGVTRSRTCHACGTTFMGAGEEVGHEA